MKRTVWMTGVAACMAITMLSGCTNEKPVIDKLAEDGSGKLRVMYYDEEQFYRQYGGYFTIQFPNIDIEVVSTQPMYENRGESQEPQDMEKKVLEFLDKEKPDIIMTDISGMKSLVEEGKLYNLDPIIQQEQYSMDDMLPGLIDLLREKGDSSGLYGLAPSYYTQALFYNADLFKEHNIEPPTNKMSWNEIVELATRFGQIGSGEDQLYGISNQYRDSGEVLQLMAQDSNLQLIDSQGDKVLVDSQGWRDVFTMVAKAVNSKAIEVVKRDENGGISYSSDESSFMNGKAAMMMESTWMINNMANTFQWNKELKPFDWQLVTVPVDPNSPDESINVSAGSVFAISNDAVNKRTAWELLKFINSPEMAKASSKMFSGDLPTRITYLKDIQGKNTEALTMLRPKSNSSVNMYETLSKLNVSGEFYGKLNSSLSLAINEIIAGKSVDDVLPKLQLQLQKDLDSAKQKGSLE